MWRKAILMCGLMLVAAGVSAQSLEEVLAKNAEARGGLDKIKGLKSVRMTGTMTVGPGMEAPLTLELKRPNNMRMEFTLQGMTGVQAYDGTTAWWIMPFMGKTDAEALPEDQAKLAAEQADFDGILIDYQAKGHTVELVGKEAVEGTDAYKLKVTLKNEDVRYVYLDAEYFLEIRTEGSRTMRGTQVDFEATVGDYKDVDGLMFPHSIETGAKGSPQKQKLTITAVELNPEIDDLRFKMPAKATP
jgi:outer membrane lipoprotein-sorting protein